jgi:hypothetical protein
MHQRLLTNYRIFTLPELTSTTTKTNKQTRHTAQNKPLLTQAEPKQPKPAVQNRAPVPITTTGNAT